MQHKATVPEVPAPAALLSGILHELLHVHIAHALQLGFTS